MSQLDRALSKAYAESAPREAVESPSREAAATSGTAAVLEQPSAKSPLSTFAGGPKIHDAASALLEVDRLAWPRACDELLAHSGSALGQFADQLVERIGWGQKIVALTSCRRGEGRTTVSLVVARQLAARGLRLVVVDADFENPSLARSCGIADHGGWGDVLDDQLVLGDALIAAVDDRITLMPWRGEPKSSSRVHSTRSATTFSMLRDHYDVVLLDTMPLADATAIDDFARFAVAIQLDALYLVHDVRTTPPAALADAWPPLRQAGLNVEGIIENFVMPDGDSRVAGPEPSQPVAGPPLAA